MRPTLSLPSPLYFSDYMFITFLDLVTTTRRELTAACVLGYSFQQIGEGRNNDASLLDVLDLWV